METENRGMKYTAANCEGTQSPQRAVELRKKKLNNEGHPEFGYKMYTSPEMSFS
jgi:hypothetical protein